MTCWRRLLNEALKLTAASGVRRSAEALESSPESLLGRWLTIPRR